MHLFFRHILQNSWIGRHTEAVLYFGFIGIVFISSLFSHLYWGFHFIGSMMLIIFIFCAIIGSICLIFIGYKMFEDASDPFEKTFGLFMGVAGIILLSFALEGAFDFPENFRSLAEDLKQ